MTVAMSVCEVQLVPSDLLVQLDLQAPEVKDLVLQDQSDPQVRMEAQAM